MWKRSELKAKAKVSFKRNYWRSVLISLLFALLVGGGTSVASSSSWREEADQTVDGEESSLEEDIEELVKDEEFKERIQSMDKKTLTIYMVGFFIGASIVFLVIMALCILLDVFICNPVEIGCDRYYIRNLREPAQVGNIGYVFDSNYKSMVKTMFFRDLYVFLWTLLLVIPGIVKAYQYMMIPYLLAENPEMTKEQAFAESKRMMSGQKWRAFVLDLSFIGWEILSLLTFGLVGMCYVNPYRDSTHAALYEKLRYSN